MYILYHQDLYVAPIWYNESLLPAMFEYLCVSLHMCHISPLWKFKKIGRQDFTISASQKNGTHKEVTLNIESYHQIQAIAALQNRSGDMSFNWSTSPSDMTTPGIYKNKLEMNAQLHIPL